MKLEWGVLKYPTESFGLWGIPAWAARTVASWRGYLKTGTWSWKGFENGWSPWIDNRLSTQLWESDANINGVYTELVTIREWSDLGWDLRLGCVCLSFWRRLKISVGFERMLAWFTLPLDRFIQYKVAMIHMSSLAMFGDPANGSH